MYFQPLIHDRYYLIQETCKTETSGRHFTDEETELIKLTEIPLIVTSPMV